MIALKTGEGRRSELPGVFCRSKRSCSFVRREGGKTFLIDTPVMVLIGLLFAPYDRPTEKLRVFTPAARASLSLAALFVLLALAGYWLNPDWMWGYFIDPAAVDAAGLIYVLLALYLLPWLAGLYLGGDLYRRGRGYWIAAVAITVVVELLLIAGLWERYNAVSSYVDFAAGNRRPLIGEKHSLALVLNGGAILLVALALFQWRRLRRQR